MFFLAVLHASDNPAMRPERGLRGMESGVEKWETLLAIWHLYHTQDKREPLQLSIEV